MASFSPNIFTNSTTPFTLSSHLFCSSHSLLDSLPIKSQATFTISPSFTRCWISSSSSFPEIYRIHISQFIMLPRPFYHLMPSFRNLSSIGAGELLQIYSITFLCMLSTEDIQGFDGVWYIPGAYNWLQERRWQHWRSGEQEGNVDWCHLGCISVIFCFISRSWRTQNKRVNRPGINCVFAFPALLTCGVLLYCFLFIFFLWGPFRTQRDR
jgi:hypothetical protein